jgi:membrane protease YdiL (CAAX protease family)
MRYIDQEQKLLVEVLLIFLLPILLIKYELIPANLRLIVLTLGVIAVAIIIVREKWNTKDIGFRFDNLQSALPSYLYFTLFGLLMLFVYAQILELPSLRVLGGGDAELKLLLTFLPISFFQEFLYRGFLMRMLSKIFSPDRHTIIFINALLFALLHIIYPHQLFILPLTFVGGLAFATIYDRKPNLILISIAHSILNYAALTLGFFIIS